MKIMVVDDEQVALRTMERLLRRRKTGSCILCDSGARALEVLEKDPVDIVLLDLIMPDMNGLSVLEQAKPGHARTEFIVTTAQDDTALAVKAIRLGAYDYLVKPLDPDRLLLTIERAYEKLSMKSGLEAGREPGVPDAFCDILTGSRLMREQLAYAAALSRSLRPVLICGPTGTGKELVARGIHRAGPRSGGPFVAVNVSAVPENLFESQFFGHCKGAFTGANDDHEGFFQQANKGTLFLDELGEMPMQLQSKLLRVLEDGYVTPVGGKTAVRVDAGIVSATNCDLEKACEQGKFRLDLLYRIRTACVTLPPLRERVGDISLLADHFLDQAGQELDRPELAFSDEARACLESYSFPGNVRELFQVVYHGALCAKGRLIKAGDLLPEATKLGAGAGKSHHLCTLKENEARHVAFVIRSANGDRRQAARILGISLRQIQRKLAALQKDPILHSLLDDR